MKFSRLLLVLPLLAVFSCTHTLKDGTYQLTVLSTDDVHGAWFDSTYTGGGVRRSLMAVKHYADSGFLGPWVSFGHAVWLDEEDFALVKESGAVLVNNASSNLRLRSGSFDLRTAARLDVTAGIGMDGCTIDDDQDFLREMRVCWLNDRESGVDAAVDPAFVLKMATSKGARIAAVKLSPGVIAPGENADLVCLNMEKVAWPYADPDVDPLALAVQRASRGCVDLTLVGGKKTWGTEPEWQERADAAADDIRRVMKKLRAADSGRRDNAEILERVRAYYRESLKR